MHGTVCHKRSCLRCESIEDVLRSENGSAESSLSLGELREYHCWRTPLRQRAYLAARILLKALLRTNQIVDPIPLSGIEILSRSGNGTRGTRPAAHLAGEQLPIGLSIAHTDSMVCVGYSSDRLRPFGVDLVRCEPVAAGFRRLWFGSEEHKAFESYAEEVWLRGWAAKEAAFKAVGGNTQFTPREIQALPESLDRWTVRFSHRQLDPLPVRIWKTRDHLLACTFDILHDPIDSTVEAKVDDWNVLLMTTT
jgi:phosphopantetheinyl transferase